MTFSSKAKKHEALKDVARTYEKNVHDKLCRLTLDLNIECRDKGDKENEERYHELYWSIPDLHNWREKHSKMFAEFAEIVEEAESLFETRKAIKETEVARNPKRQLILVKKKFTKQLLLKWKPGRLLLFAVLISLRFSAVSVFMLTATWSRTATALLSPELSSICSES